MSEWIPEEACEKLKLKPQNIWCLWSKMKVVSQSFDQVISTLTDDAWGQVVKNW